VPRRGDSEDEALVTEDLHGAQNGVPAYVMFLLELLLRVIDGSGELLTTVPRNSTGEISRFKACGTRHSH